jgi:Fe-S cluster assembly ATP-binding protein
MLKLTNLSVAAGDKTILQDINFNFEKGKTYAIIGPNGSGKSTLFHTISGNPLYKIDSRSKILFQDKIISKLSPDKRAKLGIFITFQNPPALAGITIFDLFRQGLTNKKDIITIKKKIDKYCRLLNINPELLNRSLNTDFSGGEKKKMEMLQVLIYQPKLIIFDEIDTGIDIEALKLICNQINSLSSPNRTMIIITHNFKILKYIKVDNVVVLKNGKIDKTGDIKLTEEIERKGY